MHSIYSDDGQYSVEELIKKCHDKGLKIISLSDHNSTQGVQYALEEAKKAFRDMRQKVKNENRQRLIDFTKMEKELAKSIKESKAGSL